MNTGFLNTKDEQKEKGINMYAQYDIISQSTTQLYMSNVSMINKEMYINWNKLHISSRLFV